MKANQLATLALRLMGIYILIEFIPIVSVSFTFAPYFSQANFTVYEIVSMAATVLSFLAQFAIGVLLIVKAKSWGEKFVQQNPEANVTSVSFEQVQVLAFAVVGALIFAGALSQLFGNIYSASVAFTHFNKDKYPEGMQANDWRSLWVAFGVILKTVLGLWMFFGAHGFANFWRSMKNFGTPKPPEN